MKKKVVVHGKKRVYDGFFKAEVDESGKATEGGGANFEFEDILPVHLTVEGAKKEIADGNMADAKTIIAMMWLINRIEGM